MFYFTLERWDPIMILQTGMRTDIPAFYAEWFTNRIKDGYVLVRNPYNPVQVTKYRLDPTFVNLIGFCSKNPAPMLQYMDLLKPFGMYWFVTITPYGTDIEPHVPDKEKVIDSFLALSEIVGPDAMAWRYDPIFLNETYTVDYHLKAFEHIAARLCDATKTCVISFIDLYQKVRKNFPEVRSVGKDDRIFLGNDIGAYNTCPHLCRYCYANYDEQTVRQNYAKHDPHSPFLIGNLRPEDVIHEAVQKSWVDGQMRLF